MPEFENERDDIAIPIEFPRRASRRLRVAHWLFGQTFRPMLRTLVHLQQAGVIPRGMALWFLANLDRPIVLLRPPRGTRVRREDFPQYRAEWVWDRDAAAAPERLAGAILYMHGGGLVTCGLNSHRRIVARLSTATGLPVYNIEYRQIPTVSVSQTVEDCLAGYRRLIDAGFPADRIVLAGDSAGGGLVFSVALAIRVQGLPMPRALVAIAPFANYDSAARFAHANNGTDPVLSADALSLPVKWGMYRDGVLDPALSPVNHDFAGLPTTLIQVGSTEVLRADAEEVAACCVRAGVPVRLQVWDHALHVFHAGADVLPDARDAFSEIGVFVEDALGGRSGAEPGATDRMPA
ncbi:MULTISPECIES: alpha/beta hydrolase [Tsukamurella]|uniref:alpha/beta hydrolase n=1 Tax=Tsukamurella TaxID=2060 RepID=UPI002DD43628|nr:alpha/beta hydrolase fold domain-containing protein [Tsukamurella tyrosinosolvens]MEC4614948.1 alpha/beta hydrolase fold domain-containing protein [Tsukamurella tyrosinosolvens]